MNYGESVVTGGGSSKFKIVIHASAPYEIKSYGKSQEFIEKIASDALGYCHWLKCSKIAIPPLGSGIAGVPIDKCVNGFINGFASYLSKNSPSNIQEIGIIIYD